METNGFGGLVVRCEACERRRAGKCMDCGAPVKGRAWRCEHHQRTAHRVQSARHERQHREERNAKWRKRYRKDREYRERKNALGRVWRAANPMAVALQKRKGRLAGSWGYKSRGEYLAYQRDYNAARASEKREYMKRFNVNPKPVCKGCGVEVPYQGIGQPPKWCDAHRPHSYRRKVAA